MASIPLHPAAHPESCGCQECLARLLADTPRANGAPPSTRQCHRPYRCVLDEMGAIGRINNRAYRNTWVALVALMCVLITLALSSD